MFAGIDEGQDFRDRRIRIRQIGCTSFSRSANMPGP